MGWKSLFYFSECQDWCDIRSGSSEHEGTELPFQQKGVKLISEFRHRDFGTGIKPRDLFLWTAAQIKKVLYWEQWLAELILLWQKSPKHGNVKCQHQSLWTFSTFACWKLYIFLNVRYLKGLYILDIEQNTENFFGFLGPHSPKMPLKINWLHNQYLCLKVVFLLPRNALRITEAYWVTPFTESFYHLTYMQENQP